MSDQSDDFRQANGHFAKGSRGRPVEIEVPPIRTTADLLPVGAAVSDAVLSGEVLRRRGSRRPALSTLTAR
jgi:hypothetical protein